MSALANMHSVKNRFLLRINNQTAAQALATCVPTLARDLVVLGACLTVERTLAAGVRVAVAEPEAALGEAEGDPGEGAGAGDEPRSRP